MIKKDRYSHAIIISVVFIGVALYFFSKKEYKFFSIALMLSPMYIAILALTSSRLNGIIPNSVKFKDENGCDFTGENPKHIDGLAYQGVRYKLVNGTDVYFDKNNELKPCGFGSALMQKIGGGGKEPKSIQKEECWKINSSKPKPTKDKSSKNHDNCLPGFAGGWICL